ncbi:hypothetical protein C8Q74DRAFT_1366181 [Fomes fomentarius]|nr:hypothetical protein C8Q74DRAFT_1366181 [Fomes fomentarius]
MHNSPSYDDMPGKFDYQFCTSSTPRPNHLSASSDCSSKNTISEYYGLERDSPNPHYQLANNEHIRDGHHREQEGAPPTGSRFIEHLDDSKSYALSSHEQLPSTLYPTGHEHVLACATHASLSESVGSQQPSTDTTLPDVQPFAKLTRHGTRIITPGSIRSDGLTPNRATHKDLNHTQSPVSDIPPPRRMRLLRIAWPLACILFPPILSLLLLVLGGIPLNAMSAHHIPVWLLLAATMPTAFFFTVVLWILSVLTTAAFKFRATRSRTKDEVRKQGLDFWILVDCVGPKMSIMYLLAGIVALPAALGMFLKSAVFGPRDGLIINATGIGFLSFPAILWTWWRAVKMKSTKI